MKDWFELSLLSFKNFNESVDYRYNIFKKWDNEDIGEIKNYLHSTFVKGLAGCTCKRAQEIKNSLDAGSILIANNNLIYKIYSILNKNNA